MDSIKFIGTTLSPLKNLKDCPLRENEGAPPVWIIIHPDYIQGIAGLKTGAKIIVLTWLHQAHREVLTTRPRNNPLADTLGVFATRSPDRPNPIGMHSAEILEITSSGKLKISNLEVLDGTPIIDIKPIW